MYWSRTQNIRRKEAFTKIVFDGGYANDVFLDLYPVFDVKINTFWLYLPILVGFLSNGLEIWFEIILLLLFFK